MRQLLTASISSIVEELTSRPTFKEDLTRWFSFEAFDEVEGWRRNDTGKIGYFFPAQKSAKEEDAPFLSLTRDDYGLSWSWVIRDERTQKVEGCSGYKLAGQAADAGRAAFEKLYPGAANG